MAVDQALKQWATDRQKEYLDAIDKHDSLDKAATSLGVNTRTVTRSMAVLKARAVIQGYSPEHDMTKPAPLGFTTKGTSTLYGRDGEQKLQWVKTQRDSQAVEEAIKEYINWLAQDVKGLAEPIPAPIVSDSDLLSVYPLADIHFGLYAWAQEAGDDFDLVKAEQLVMAAFDRLTSVSPNSERALLLGLGDLLHADNSSNVTAKSGNVLDVDTRYAKVMQVALRAMRYGVDALLKKHKAVDVWVLQGNHDIHSSYAVSLCLDAFYANETRVNVDLSPAMFRYLQFGKVLLGATHGHTVKPAELPAIMANDKPAEWGLTEYRYWYSGHIHHKTRQEYRGVVHETFRTLAARDAWHTGAGYRAGRDIELIVHHKDYGEIERHVSSMAMLSRAA